jgi:hypothetical protein
MDVKSPFVLKDLPGCDWSVSWPGHEREAVNSSDKILTLLSILFDTVKSSHISLSVFRPDYSGYPVRSQILDIDAAAWFQDPHGAAAYVDEFIVDAVKFDTLAEAEAFKRHMEQRYIWKKLGGAWK